MKMIYTAKQIADAADIPLHTLRYYVKLGLLPFVHRTANGQRQWQEKDIGWLKQLQALKNTGLTLNEIAQFVKWVEQGDSTIAERLALFEQQQQKVRQHIARLNQDLHFIEKKCELYQTALKEGTVSTAQCLEML